MSGNIYLKLYQALDNSRKKCDNDKDGDNRGRQNRVTVATEWKFVRF